MQLKLSCVLRKLSLVSSDMKCCGENTGYIVIDHHHASKLLKCAGFIELLDTPPTLVEAHAGEPTVLICINIIDMLDAELALLSLLIPSILHIHAR